VLLGLQSNALKFTREGSVIIEVEIITEDDNNFLQIHVKDSGVGIPQED
jgi:signal transduction histidine kinase